MRLRRGKPKQHVERILVATDRSETAERAVTFAQEMAERYEAQLVLLRVLLSDDGVLAEATTDLAEHARAHASSLGSAATRRSSSRKILPMRSSRRSPGSALTSSSSGASA